MMTGYATAKGYERLCGTCALFDEDKFESISLMLRAGALPFYEYSTRAMVMSYRDIILAFNPNYDSPTRREENIKILSTLSLTSTRGTERDHHAALKELIERIELLATMSAIWYRDSEAKSRILLYAIFG